VPYSCIYSVCVKFHHFLQVTATDPDRTSPDDITYDIYAPSGTLSTVTGQVVNSMAVYQSVVRQSFSVARLTGAMSLRRALSRDLPFGFSPWQINVLAADDSGSSTSKTGYGIVTFELEDINNHAPVFDTCCLRGSVPEDSSQGKGLTLCRDYMWNKNNFEIILVLYFTCNHCRLLRVKPNTEIISKLCRFFISRVITSETEIKLFRPMKF